MRYLIREYRASLKRLRNSQVSPLYRNSMISDTLWAIECMETGCIPDAKWAVARWSKKDREVLLDPQVLDRYFSVSKAAPETDPEHEHEQRLEQMLSKLSKREREAFVLVKGQGFSYQEAAVFMGCSRSSVQMFVRRAKSKLSDLVIQKQANSEGVF